MKFSHQLIKKYFPKTPAPVKVAELLTEHSFEVEGFENASFAFSGVYTAKVTGVEKHPNADRLRVIKLTTGKQEIYPIVCGAHNFGEGDIVALALPGAYIPQNIHSDAHEGFTLEKATIRGVESQGMICAGFELGLVPKPDKGILIFPKNTKLGIDLKDYLSDTIYDFALTPSRPDAFSHLGVARELAVLTKQKFTEPKQRLKYSSKPKHLSLAVKAKNNCNDFYAALIELINVPETPPDLQAKLLTLGARSVNLIVDITNIVMYELGRPTHAFDFDKTDKKIQVRMSHEGETFTALNHKTFTLDNDTMVIADGKKVLDIAGVMGGLDTEITSETKNILLTSVNFKGGKVRQAARKYAIESHAPRDFEKGLYPSLASLGIEAFISYLDEYGVKYKLVETVVANQHKHIPHKISISSEKISNLLGIDISFREIASLLKQSGVVVKQNTAVIPEHRLDLKDNADLAEEVLRLYGITNVKPRPLSITSSNPQGVSVFIRQLKETSARLGMNEVQNYSFISQKDLDAFGQYKDAMEIENPQSDELRFLRKQLLFNMLHNVQVSMREAFEFTLFEVGRKFDSYENQPLLFTALAYAKSKTKQQTYLELKGKVEALLMQLGIPFEYHQDASSWLTIKSGVVSIGLVGVMESKFNQSYKIDGSMAFAKLEIEKITDLTSPALYTASSAFPSIFRDLSLVVPQELSFRQIEEGIESVGGETLVSVMGSEIDDMSNHFVKSLKDKGLKNLIIKLEFNAGSRNLTDQEVASNLDQILVKLKDLNIEIR